MASHQNLQKSDQQTVSEAAAPQQSGLIALISLRIEDGLLMAFSPDGDPLPPSLVRQAGADAPEASLRLHEGTLVPSNRVLAVLDAQQQGPLSERPHAAWVEAMLGFSGSYEATPEELLNAEPNTPLPPMAA